MHMSIRGAVGNNGHCTSGRGDGARACVAKPVCGRGGGLCCVCACTVCVDSIGAASSRGMSDDAEDDDVLSHELGQSISDPPEPASPHAARRAVRDRRAWRPHRARRCRDSNSEQRMLICKKGTAPGHPRRVSAKPFLIA